MIQRSFVGIVETLSSCLETMRALIEKFPCGYEGWAKDKGENPAPRPPRLSPAFDYPA